MTTARNNGTIGLESLTGTAFEWPIHLPKSTSSTGTFNVSSGCAHRTMIIGWICDNIEKTVEYQETFSRFLVVLFSRHGAQECQTCLSSAGITFAHVDHHWCMLNKAMYRWLYTSHCI